MLSAVSTAKPFISINNVQLFRVDNDGKPLYAIQIPPNADSDANLLFALVNNKMDSLIPPNASSYRGELLANGIDFSQLPRIKSLDDSVEFAPLVPNSVGAIQDLTFDDLIFQLSYFNLLLLGVRDIFSESMMLKENEIPKGGKIPGTAYSLFTSGKYGRLAPSIKTDLIKFYLELHSTVARLDDFFRVKNGIKVIDMFTTADNPIDRSEDVCAIDKIRNQMKYKRLSRHSVKKLELVLGMSKKMLLPTLGMITGVEEFDAKDVVRLAEDPTMSAGDIILYLKDAKVECVFETSRGYLDRISSLVSGHPPYADPSRIDISSMYLQLYNSDELRHIAEASA